MDDLNAGGKVFGCEDGDEGGHFPDSSRVIYAVIRYRVANGIVKLSMWDMKLQGCLADDVEIIACCCIRS